MHRVNVHKKSVHYTLCDLGVLSWANLYKKNQKKKIKPCPLDTVDTTETVYR